MVDFCACDVSQIYEFSQVDAIAQEPEVCEPRYVLLGGQGRSLVKVDFSMQHCRSPFVEHRSK